MGLCSSRRVPSTHGSQGAARMVMSGFGDAWQSWSGPDGTACPGSVTQGSHGRHVTFRRVPSRQRKAVRSRQGPARTGPSSRVIATQGSRGGLGRGFAWPVRSGWRNAVKERPGWSCRGSVTQGSHGRHVTFRRVPSRQRKAVMVGLRESGEAGRVLATQGNLNRREK